MFSANPRAVPEARLLTRLDYEEAQEIATTGAKVLHPRCIQPCRDARVPIWIRDTGKPDLAGTQIDIAAVDAAPGVKAISSRRGIVLVSMESIGMWQQVGFLADVFERFKRHGLSVDLIGSAEANVTVSLDPSDNLNSNVLDAIARLGGSVRVKVIARGGGNDGRARHALAAAQALRRAGRVRARARALISRENDLNLTFVSTRRFAEGMLPLLHELLIQAGPMPVREARVRSQLCGPERSGEWHDGAWGARRTACSTWPAAYDDLVTISPRGTRARALNDIGASTALYALKASRSGIMRASKQRASGSSACPPGN